MSPDPVSICSPIPFTQDLVHIPHPNKPHAEKMGRVPMSGKKVLSFRQT